MNDPVIFAAPSGRRLPEPDGPPGLLGSVGSREPATAKRVAFARQQLHEIPAADLERSDEGWLDGRDGKVYEIVRSHVDLVEVTDGATAFTVMNEVIVPLRPAGWVEPAPVVRNYGTVGGREVGRS